MKQTSFIGSFVVGSFLLTLGACTVTTSSSGSGSCPFSFQKGKRGSTATSSGAKAANQKVEAANLSGASTKGSSYEGANCDASSEGIGWCDGDHSVALCNAGQFYVQDCGSDVCVTFDDNHQIGCAPAACAE